MGANIKTIDSRAFSGCTSLAEVTFKGLTPPAPIREDAFFEAPAKGVVHCPGGAGAAYRTALADTQLNLWEMVEGVGGGQATEDPIERIEGLSVSLEAASVQTPEDAKAQLSQQLNAVLAPSGLAVTEADITIANYTQATSDADGGFDYSVNIKTGEETQTVCGKAVIHAPAGKVKLTAMAAHEASFILTIDRPRWDCYLIDSF